jgi:hypothetical protein
MNHILELRQSIGHPPILMIGGVILVFYWQNCLLMMKRSDSYLWSVASGAIKPVIEQFQPAFQTQTP